MPAATSSIAPSPRRSFADAVLLTLLVVAVTTGLAFRVAYFLRDRSLWFDEAALASNILGRTYGGLLQPLNHSQTAAPLFLFLLKTVSLAIGPGERALRLLSFISGVALLPVGFAAARRLAGMRAAMFATAMLAVCPILASYSSEVKPYATDALVAAWLILLALRARDSEFDRLLPLAAAGVIGLLLSTPAIFTLGGIAAYLLVQRPFPRRARSAVILAVVWGASFAGLLLTVHAAAISSTHSVGEFLHDFWKPWFLDVGWAELPARARELYYELVPTVLLGKPPRLSGATIAVLLTVGAVRLLRPARQYAGLLLVVPAALLVMAARLAAYPMAPRLVLFIFLPVSVLIGAALFDWKPGRRTVAVDAMTCALAAAMIVFGGLQGWREVHDRSIRTEESRAFIAEILRDSADTTPVWRSGGARPAWEYYSAIIGWTKRTTPRPEIISARILNKRPPPPVAVRDSVTRAWASSEITAVRERGPGCTRFLLVRGTSLEASTLIAAILQSGGRITDEAAAMHALRFRGCFD